MTTTDSLATSRGQRRPLAHPVSEAGRFGLPALGAVLLILFSLLLPDTFATWSNYRFLLDGQTEVAILALSGMLPLLIGEFDLSIAATLGLSQIIMVGLVAQHGFPVWLAVTVSLAVASAIGAVNGLLIVKWQVNAFVATLASQSVVAGLGLWYTGGQTIFQNVPPALTGIARNDLFGLPLPAVYLAVLTVGLWILTSRTGLGRRMLAVGSNRRAATMLGIRSDRCVIGAFVASSVLAAVAGIVLGARLGSASTSSGVEMLLPALAGAFLGATTITPGRFNVVGTVVAIYTVSITLSGLQQLGAPIWVQPVFNGVVLACAVALSGAAVRSRQARAAKQVRSKPDSVSGNDPEEIDHVQ